MEYKRKRGWLNRTLEKVEDLPVRVFTGDRPITDSARRELYEQGIVGQAEILEAPSERRVSEVGEADGSFRFRVEVPGPEPDEVPVSIMDATQIREQGARATATVLKTAKLDQTAPGSGDPLYLMNLELRSESEPEPWKVQIGQRVPKGAEDLIADGSQLQVAYMEVDEGDSVAVDWPATTGGGFS